MSITKFEQLNLNKLYTYTDYLTWQFEERVELIKGKVFKMAAPLRRHQSLAGRLTGIFFQNFEVQNLRGLPCAF